MYLSIIVETHIPYPTAVWGYSMNWYCLTLGNFTSGHQKTCKNHLLYKIIPYLCHR